MGLLVLLAAPAFAGPGFIVSSQVNEGSLYSEIKIQFRCNVKYLDHEPAAKSDVLRIRLEPMTVCAGAPPSVALNRELHRPLAADDAWVDSLEYVGDTPGDENLRIEFTEEVTFQVRQPKPGNWLSIRVFAPSATAVQRTPTPDSSARLARRDMGPTPNYVINLQSSRQRPTSADMPSISAGSGKELFVSEALIDGSRWYRIRVGYFATASEAAQQLKLLRERYPSAWIGREVDGDTGIAEVRTAVEQQPSAAATPLGITTDDSSGEIASLMADGRRAMTAGELSKAVQIFTKVLQLPANEFQPDAQEFLALARERNGQIAHAKAEYERYLVEYPDGAGAERVRQRLAALLATGRPAPAVASSADRTASGKPARKPNPWSLRTFVSQYYRRDANQVNEQEQVVNQSSIYTDVSIDARRRGERFDLSTRLTAGYRSDLMSDTETNATGNDLRLSYAYADLADSRTGLRGRLGRQTRNTGGVLGRFDGLNLTYALSDSLRFEAVAGQPVYSTSRDTPDSRFFSGVSTTFAPFSDSLDLGLFYLQQDIEGLTDRRAVGAELRYFGETRSLWGIASYDAEFDEIGSLFLQGSWRLPGDFTVTGLVDVRRSPFLSLGNAIVGQQVESFEDLRILFTEEELRQFALDRSPQVTTYSAGLSRPLTPKLQFNLQANHSAVDAAPASGGVLATDNNEYSYYSADLVASSVFTEGDVGIFGLRYSVSDTTSVYSTSIDSRFPLGRAWRINPRLRVDYREIRSNMSTQWIYTPELRVQYRPGRRWRLQLDLGRQYSFQAMQTTDLDRESYFINLGYQFFY